MPWESLRQVQQEARELAREDYTKPLVDCPVCGIRLDENAVTKEKNCRMGHFRSNAQTAGEVGAQ